MRMDKVSLQPQLLLNIMPFLDYNSSLSPLLPPHLRPPLGLLQELQLRLFTAKKK